MYSHGVEVAIVPDEEGVEFDTIIVRMNVEEALAEYPAWIIRDIKKSRLSKKELKERLDRYTELANILAVGVREIPLRQ